MPFPVTLVGDSAGFVALLLIAASSLAMVYRKRILSGGAKLSTVRWMHLALSTGAAGALGIHVSLFVGYPATTGVLLGYAAFAAALSVWLTGSAFVERIRDSLVFHGQLTVVAVGLILAHTSETSVALGGFAPFVIGSVVFVVLLNGVHHLSKLKETLR